MRFDRLEVSAPLILGGDCNDAEVLGAAAWLWMHSQAHRDAPLHTLSALLLPALKHRQFVLASEDGKPVFYMSWANLDEEAERRYLANPPVCMPPQDWASGERMWIVDWVAPFGHSRAMSRLLARRIFSDRCARTLYHRGDKRGLRILTFHGVAVLPEEARFWFDTHPVALGETLQPCS